MCRSRNRTTSLRNGACRLELPAIEQLPYLHANHGQGLGEFVDRLGGHYITAKDVGMGSADLKIVKTRTRHVLGMDGEPGSSGQINRVGTDRAARFAPIVSPRPRGPARNSSMPS